MKKILFICLVALITGTFFMSCDSDDGVVVQQMEDDMEDDTPTEPLAAEVQLNVPYGSDPQQVYDLYLPEGREADKTKVIVIVHGGGWIEGDKADVAAIIDLLQINNPNHAIVNINYRLATLNTPAFPNQFLDLEAVINQVISLQDTYQILPEFGLLGLSAGAHISLQYDSVYDVNDNVKFVCDIVGPSDFTDPFYQDNPNFDLYLAALTDESAYPAGTDFAVALSPALQVSIKTSPTILFYGNTDELVPLSNGETLNSQLEANGINHQYTVYDGGHGNWNEAQFTDLEQKLSIYIDAYLNIEE